MRSFRLLPLLVITLAGAFTAVGQVTINVETDRHLYIRYEEIMLKITLQNNSGNNLAFGSGEDAEAYIRIYVTDPQGVKLTMPSAPNDREPAYLNAANGLILPPGINKSVLVPINEFYKFSRTGFYRIEVRIHHPRMRHDYISTPIQIKIGEGLVKWERDIGVPGSGDDIPFRHVSVNIFQADKSQLYYLFIRDEDFVYSLRRLAPHVRGVAPQIEVDARSHIHFFTQTQPRLFSHYAFDVDGTLKEEAHYIVEPELPIPRLIRDPDIGRVMIAGGRRARDGSDFNDVSLPTMDAEEIAGAPEARK